MANNDLFGVKRCLQSLLVASAHLPHLVFENFGLLPGLVQLNSKLLDCGGMGFPLFHYLRSQFALRRLGGNGSGS